MLDRLRKALGNIGEHIAEVAGAGITVSEERAEEIANELVLELVQADVALDAAEKIAERIKSAIGGKKFSSRKDIRDAVRSVLVDLLSREAPKIVPPPEKPYIIMFVGPNGVGKTTTIAKLAHQLRKHGYSVVIAAADTFRAGSIEQTEEWAKRVGARVVKHSYGADPAAVAFDAVKSARARDDDYVLIDTAGRQETNENLMEQLKKIKRVVKPHLTVFVGEGMVGSAVAEQIRRFHEELGLDGIILTKMDTDTKGGAVLTAAVAAEVPIIYLGWGEAPEDLKLFDPEEFVSKILPEA